MKTPRRLLAVFLCLLLLIPPLAFADEPPYSVTVHVGTGSIPVRARMDGFENNVYLCLPDLSAALSSTSKQFRIDFASNPTDGDHFIITSGQPASGPSAAQEGTALGSRESVKGFRTLTDLFTIYNMPVNVDNFYQHFRNGDYPIGIADFYTYNLIRNAAPELDGSWAIALIPGTPKADGTIDRTTCGCAESTVIFKSDPEREAKAWEFIKWWSSRTVQAEFGRMVQSIYGDEYIWPTANMEAFDLLPWDTADKRIVRTFARSVVDVARVPGTYMLEREMSNAFNDIVVGGENEQTRIDRAVKTINREIRRKLEEFGYLDSEGNVLREYRIPTMDTMRTILGR